MTDRQLASRNAMVDWQVAPADYEIANYDEPKARYRQYVEDFLATLPMKSLKKKTFVTISTNVLCAVTKSSKDTLDPIERDIYLPLEIALTKWSVAEADKSSEDRTLSTKVWILDPGAPPFGGSVGWAKDHKKLHKINYDKFKASDTYIERDLQAVVKEINGFLTPDRLVFSTQLRNCRQDLGSLKWLNRETNSKMKPIKVYSIEDLYVVLIRRMVPDCVLQAHIGQGIARYRMEYTSNLYENKVKCQYHQDIVKEDPDNDCGNCASAVAICYSQALLNDITYFTQCTTGDALEDINQQFNKMTV